MGHSISIYFILSAKTTLKDIQMGLAKILQIIGIIVVLDALYFGIAKDSMKTEVLLLFIGGMIFYVGRIFEKRGK